MKYRDIDHAVQAYLKLKESANSNKQDSRYWDGCDIEEKLTSTAIFGGKTDVKSAFRLVPLRRQSWPWLIMKAQDPVTGKWQYFVDKCLPFGASISCAIFQEFSDALKHLIEYRMSENHNLDVTDTITNYLDDFLFLAITLYNCNLMIEEFLAMCELIGVPIAAEKTEWGAISVIFLGILLDGENLVLRVPLEKRVKAINLIKSLLDKWKATIRELQELCGYLNFLCKAIFPGRAFLRRMYSKYSKIANFCHIKNSRWNESDEQHQQLQLNFTLKLHHHVRLDSEFKNDCRVWLEFLDQNSDLSKIVNRPMIDILTPELTSQEIVFYSDASAAKTLGFGCIFGSKWIMDMWGDFITKYEPSIEYLELFALTAGLYTWQEEIRDCRITVFCDNQATVCMINNLASTCKNCMVLIRMITLNGLQFNRRVRAKFVPTKQNGLADALLRGQMARFRRLGPHMSEKADKIPEIIWPVEKLWLN